MKNRYDKIASKITKATGSPVASVAAVALVIVWALCGPIFNYSETWQLIINTSTTIITFLMVFIIQQSQNKDTAAIHMKLNELIASSPQASNRLVDLEELTEKDIELIRTFYRKLANVADKEHDIHQSHSLDEAVENNVRKKRALHSLHEGKK